MRQYRSALAIAAALMTIAQADAQRRGSGPRRLVSHAAPSPAGAGTVAATLAAGAPFARVTVTFAPMSDECDQFGCAVTFTGITRAGARVDITQSDRTPNGLPSSKTDTFGAVDGGGMPRIVVVQVGAGQGLSHNLYTYSPTLKRYTFDRAVAGSGWRTLLGGNAGDRKMASRSSNAAPPPVHVDTPRDLALRGEYQIPRDPSACTAQSPGVSVEAVRLIDAQQWSALLDLAIATRCGSVYTISWLGQALFGLDRYQPAMIYFNQMRTLQADKTAPKALKCQGFLCGGNIRTQAEAYISSAEGLASGRLVRRAAVQAPPAETVAQVGAVNSASGPMPVWSLGRARYLVERGAQCLPGESLGKPYCFGEAIEWLQRHRDRSEIDVVAMHQSWLPGSMIPHASGQGWDIYRVARQGDGFRADKQLHYAIRIPIPRGCLVTQTGDQAWYISFAQGRKAAVEARQYGCQGWAGPQVDPRGADLSLVEGGPLAVTTLAASQDAGAPTRFGAQSQAGSAADGGCTGAMSESRAYRECEVAATHRRMVDDLLATAPPPADASKTCAADRDDQVSEWMTHARELPLCAANRRSSSTRRR